MDLGKADDKSGGITSVSRRGFALGTLATGAAVSALTTEAASQVATPSGPGAIPNPELRRFARMSELLTGVPHLKNFDLIARYFERCEQHPLVGPQLARLLELFDTIVKSNDVEAAIKTSIVGNGELWPAAQQIIYLWYTSAFMNNRGEQEQWEYGPASHFAHGLIWSLIGSHPPMITGGEWTDRPQI